MKRTTAIAAAAALVLLAFALPAHAHAQNIGTVMGDTMTYRGANTTKPKIEATSHVSILDKDLTSPPGSPTDGTWYLVPATGWSGLHANDEARYSTLLGWSYLTPGEGWVVWVADENRTYTFHDGAWSAEAGSGDASGPSSSTDNALARFDGTTGKVIQNSTVTLSDAGAMAWTNSSTSSALSIVQTGTTSGLLSGPAAFQLNLDADVGAGFGIVTSAAYTGHPFQIYSTNVAAAISAAYIQSWGVRPSLQVEHFGSGSTVGNAALIYSENTSDSSLGVIGHESARGTAKIRHIDPGGDDHNASVLSLKNDGSTTEAQGIFYDCDSPPGLVGTPDACGKILNLRVQNIERFVLDSLGNSDQTGEARSYSLRIEPLGSYSASPSIGGAMLYRGTNNTGAGFVLYTDMGASADGDLISGFADNVAFDRNLLSLTQDGTAPIAVFTQNSETASANAMQLISHNDLASTAYFQGEELGLGTLRVHHIYSSGDDHNSAALVLTNAGASSASMGMFMDLVSTGTGAMLNLRSGGTERLTLLPAGFMTVTSDSTSHGFALDCNGNTSASSSVGGCHWIENTGNSGAAEVIYTNHASSTARVVSVRADNVGYAGEVVAIDNDGTNNALRVNQNSNNAGANGVLVSSANTLDSAAEFNGVATSQPAVRIQHTGAGADSSASGLQVNLAGTTAARGVFVTTSSGVVTTGNIFEGRNDTHTPYVLGPTGNVTFGGGLTLGTDLAFATGSVALLQAPASATAGVNGTALTMTAGAGLARTGATPGTNGGATIVSAAVGGTAVNAIGGEGGATTVRGGAGGATSGNGDSGLGGAVNVLAGASGASSGNASAEVGGEVLISGGAGGAKTAGTGFSGPGGEVSIEGGLGGSVSTAQDGATGGAVNVNGGDGSAAGGSSSNTGGAGGPVTVLGGNGASGAPSDGVGGDAGDARIDSGSPGPGGAGEGGIVGAYGNVFVGDQAATFVQLGHPGAQVSVGGTSTTTGVIFKIDSVSKAFMPPQLTATARDALTPIEGMCAYITTAHELQCYNGTAWAH